MFLKLKRFFSCILYLLQYVCALISVIIWTVIINLVRVINFFETIIIKIIVDYSSGNKHFNVKQYGYSSSRSLDYDYSKNVWNTLYKIPRNYYSVKFLKFFGKVWYLLQTISSYVIFGNVFSIIKHFLSGILKNVFIHVQYSEEYVIKDYVTQDSYLSTLQRLCFIIMIYHGRSHIIRKYICKQCQSSYRYFAKSRWPKHGRGFLPLPSSMIDLHESFDYDKIGSKLSSLTIRSKVYCCEVAHSMKPIDI